MGPVERAIRGSVAPGETLVTPTGRGQFVVERMDDVGLVLLLGKGRWWTRLTWRCLEGIVPYLARRSWVMIGSRYDTHAYPETLDGYLKGCVKRATAGWVAVVLERAGIVDVDRSRPVRVRLRRGIARSTQTPRSSRGPA